MLSPAIPEEEGDPVLPSSSARVASSRSRRASIVPAERAIPEVDAASERDRQEVRPMYVRSLEKATDAVWLDLVLRSAHTTLA